MTVVSAKEFNARQPHYLSLVRRGEHVVLRSRGGRYRIIYEPQEEEPERDITTEVCEAMRDWKDFLDGKNTEKFRPAEELIDELRNL